MKMVDLILFMGQSNMAGRGDDLSLAPPVKEGVGYEYRAVSAPDRLMPVSEPFGAEENNPAGVWEPGMKTGSMVSSFINACYKNTRVPVVGVSCSKGGSSILQWMPGTPFWLDAAERCERAKSWLSGNGYPVRSVSMAWCQGCTDGDQEMTAAEYKKNTALFFRSWLEFGVQQIFLIRIGDQRDEPQLYEPVQEAQEELAKEISQVVMVSRGFKNLRKMGLMKDLYHYKQEGYNLIGAEAGAAAGRYLAGLSQQRCQT